MWRLSWVCVALGFSLCLLACTAVAVTDPSSGPAEGSGGLSPQTADSPNLYVIVPGINDHGAGMLKGVLGGPEALWPAMARPGSVVVSIVEASWKNSGLSERDVELDVREEVAAALEKAEASGTDVVVLVDMDLEDYSVVRELPLPEALNRWHPSTAWAGTMITSIAEEFTLRTPDGYRWLGGHSAGVDAIRMHLRASPGAMFDRVDVFNGRTPWQELHKEVEADGYSPSRFFVWTNDGDLPAMPRSLSYAASARQGSDAWTHMHAWSLSGANLRVVSIPNHSVLLTSFGLQGDLVVSMNGQVVGRVSAAPRQIIPGSAELPTRTSAPLGVIVGGGLPALGEGWETSGPDDEGWETSGPDDEGWETSGPDDEGWALIRRGDWTEWKHVLCATDPPEVAAAKVKRRALMMGQGPGSPVVVAGDPESEEVQAVVAALRKVGYSEEDIVRVDTGGLSREAALRKTALEMHRVGATTGVIAPGQRAAAADLLSTDPEGKLARTLLAADWAAVLAILDAKKDEDLSPVERFIKGHACLAVNRNNDSLQLFLGATAPEDLLSWHAYAAELETLNPEAPVADYLLGDSLARLGRYDEAIAALDAGLEMEPQETLLLNAQGVCFARMGNLAEARRCFEAAAASPTDLADAHANMGWYWIQRSEGAEGAIRHFDAALQIDPHFSLALLGRAEVKLIAGDDTTGDDFAGAAGQGEFFAGLVDLALVEHGLRLAGATEEEAAVEIADIGTTLERTYTLDRLTESATRWGGVAQRAANGDFGILSGPIQRFAENRMVERFTRANERYGAGALNEMVAANDITSTIGPQAIQRVGSWNLDRLDTQGRVLDATRVGILSADALTVFAPEPNVKLGAGATSLGLRAFESGVREMQDWSGQHSNTLRDLDRSLLTDATSPLPSPGGADLSWRRANWDTGNWPFEPFYGLAYRPTGAG